MHFLMEMALVISMFVSLLAAAWGCLNIWKGQTDSIKWLERGQLLVISLVVFSSIILLCALITRDFSFKYVADYTSLGLSNFYAVTAFWAGRPGSLLFWLLVITVGGTIFLGTKKYSDLPEETKVAYWMLYFAIQAFFLFILTSASPPFTQLANIPADGTGLNPLLQNPGMAFHPPLLFFGYGLFTVPACLSIAMAITRGEDSWMKLTRGWVLPAWSFLSAGIVLGAWWAYMELGWGGYWAWDPVENASIIPWFVATAYLHTSILGQRYGVFKRINIILVNLTFLMCVVGTYIVRSGIIASVHAFGGGGVGGLLLAFILFYLFLTLSASFFANVKKSKLEANAFSRQGLLVITVWTFIALGTVIFLGTMWPVISLGWETNPVGVNAGFYNTVTMPLFTLIGLLLLICPWFSWNEGIQDKTGLAVSIFTALCLSGAAWFGGIRMILPLIAFGSGAGIIASTIMLALRNKTLSSKRFWIAHGTHLGVALMIIGVAISGPYATTQQVAISEGQTFSFSGYEFTYKELTASKRHGIASKMANIVVSKNGQEVGILKPEQLTFPGNNHPHSEVSTIFSFGRELYATIHDIKNGRLEPLTVSVHPLVNWIWVGGTLVTLFPFVVFFPARKKKLHSPDAQ
ncbi:heme lyase CcmF/NrfE family subunit [Maridesulfovibrio ferrireducens]|uniref:heme lyase CcmF/NrfE family subunit n=1 Tax=Maridesulfovibrio ferrireducens TaxID=246191 RepID=UPI001A308210|nr:cytochrome c biogenesis protein CcsA [Maridesulfovibrio ferrireducens]MBI9111914.1 cytochrome c biogenesis protein CcsA [Maridesulfovibrio ferrireducens]